MWFDEIADNSKLTRSFLKAVDCGYHPSVRNIPEQLFSLLEHEWSDKFLSKLGLQILMWVIVSADTIHFKDIFDLYSNCLI